MCCYYTTMNGDVKCQQEAGDLTDRPVLTVEETAQLLKISRGSAYQACQAGEIPTIRIGRRLLVPRAQLEAMLSGRAQAELVERSGDA